MNIFVGNLSFDVAGDDIKKLFEGFGKVASAVIVTRKEKKTPKARGFGFVEMPDEPQALAAIAALSGKEFMGRVLKVNPAYLKKEIQSGSESGKKVWPKVKDEAKQYPREEREQRKPWINPAFNKSGTHRGPRSAGSYMKRDGSTEIRGEAKPWSKPRRSGFKPWERTEGQSRPWKRPESGFEPGKKAQGEAKPWRKREDQSRPWQKRPSEHKPWKRVEEGASQPWRKAEGEAKPWSKPRRSGFKPWERTESQSRPWKRPEGGFESGKKPSEETKPWRKREDQSGPWQKSPGEGKPWKKAEEGDRRPWRKAEGEAKPWSKSRNNFKPWERTEGNSRPRKMFEGGFKPGQKTAGEFKSWKKPAGDTKPWSKSSERPRRSRFNPSASSFDKRRINPERVKRVEGPLRTALSERSEPKGRGRTKGRKKPG
ncbi:MAG: hypothetical protein Q7J72_06900 [Candidatus Omnitrophota bacterium]|nr:hypothetical protein [Candidatus Omnitrophota bacterium]